MKLKYSLSAWPLPKLKQNNSHNPTVINRRNKEQKYFAIALLLLWLLIYLLVPGKAHGQTANGLTIGQQVPDITITGILNAPYNSAKISDYKGKILVLDFWATWCVSCINNLGKTYALQRQFPDQLRVLLVNCKSTRDNAEKVMAFFNSRKAYYSFPSVVGDTVLGQLFPHQTVPHYVWIKDNKVVAITDAFEMSASNVEAMISGSDAHIHQEVVLNYDFNKPLFEDQNGGTPSGYIYKSFLAYDTSKQLVGEKDKSKYLFSEKNLIETGLPKDNWPLNNGVSAITIEKATPNYEISLSPNREVDIRPLSDKQSTSS